MLVEGVSEVWGPSDVVIFSLVKDVTLELSPQALSPKVSESKAMSAILFFIIPSHNRLSLTLKKRPIQHVYNKPFIKNKPFYALSI